VTKPIRARGREGKKEEFSKSCERKKKDIVCQEKEKLF